MFKSLNGGLLPQRATKHSAGFDVFANENVVIGAGETALVGLGIALDENQIEELHDRLRGTGCNKRLFMGLYLELHPRSSLRAKGLSGGVGIIDIDFKDEIKMIITNPSDRQERYTIKRGDKIGQLILKRHEGNLMPIEYTQQIERIGGIGSTGA